MKIYDDPMELIGEEGTQLGPTEWMSISQDRVNMFADATDDHQWIHVDPIRAKEGPFGGAIAHGYLTLSLASKFLPQLLEVRNLAMGINYGLGKVRFIAPVRVGTWLRARGEFVSIEDVSGGVQSTLRLTIEIKGEDKPACVIDTISRYYPGEK